MAFMPLRLIACIIGLSHFTHSFPTRDAVVVPLPGSQLRKRDGDPSAKSVYLNGFEKCTTSNQDAIYDSWQEMLDISNVVKGNIHYEKQAEVEFLGYYTKNTDWQVTLTKVLENPTTWVRGQFAPWDLNVRCDDFLRSNPECPKGTLKADKYKCGSRCFRNTAADGKPPIWKYNALAYTLNKKPGERGAVAKINFCPGFFDQRSCPDAYDKWSGSGAATEKLNLNNYVCRGSTVLHELFHVDDNSHYIAPRIKHVTDRSIRFYDKDLGTFVNRQAYGPFYTKIMAKWTGDVGFYVATNADSLALYSLAKWVSSKLGTYPKYPLSGDEQPIKPPSDKSLTLVNGVLNLGSKTALGADLGVSPDDAYSYLSTKVGPCSDADADMACNSTSNNAPLELNDLPELPSTPTPTPTPTPTEKPDLTTITSCSTSTSLSVAIPACAQAVCPPPITSKHLVSECSTTTKTLS